MELIKPKVKDYPGKHIEFEIENPDMDFEEAKDIAKQKAEGEICIRRDLDEFGCFKKKVDI